MLDIPLEITFIDALKNSPIPNVSAEINDKLYVSDNKGKITVYGDPKEKVNISIDKISKNAILFGQTPDLDKMVYPTIWTPFKISTYIPSSSSQSYKFTIYGANPIDLLKNYVQQVENFRLQMINKIKQLCIKYPKTKYGENPCEEFGRNTAAAYLGLLEYNNQSKGFIDVGHCASSKNEATFPCKYDDPSPLSIIDDLNTFSSALQDNNKQVRKQARTRLTAMFKDRYAKMIQYWNETYTQLEKQLQNKYNQYIERNKPKIIWYPGWGPKPKNLPADWKQQIERMNNDVKHGDVDNTGALVDILKSGHDPVWLKFKYGKYKGMEYPSDVAYSKIVSSDSIEYHKTHPTTPKCTKEHICYHLGTTKWTVSDQIKYAKNSRNEWVIIQSPDFKKIKKIIMVGWNGDKRPVYTTRFMFITLYDRDSQLKQDPTQLFFQGIDNTLNISKNGIVESVLYHILDNGKIIAYGPITQNSNANAISEYVDSIPKSATTYVPPIFLRSTTSNKPTTTTQYSSKPHFSPDSKSSTTVTTPTENQPNTTSTTPPENQPSTTATTPTENQPNTTTVTPTENKPITQKYSESQPPTKHSLSLPILLIGGFVLIYFFIKHN